MSFLDIALRYLAFGVPAFLLYVLALRKSGANPTFLGYIWTGGNVAAAAFLVYRGIATGLGPVRAVLYTTGAVFAVLVPITVVVAVVAGREREKE